MAEKDPHVTGARIARRRHQLDWSQVELARRLGVSPTTVANWERGASYPKKKLGKVEQVLGITLDGEPQPEPPPRIPEGLRRDIMNEESLTPAERQAVIDAVERQLAIERGEPSEGDAVPFRPSERPRRASLPGGPSPA